MKNWGFSIFMIPIYLATFLLWQQFPSRTSFLVGGLASATVLTVGLLWAVKRSYFVNKADLFFHACVILDVIIEGGFYEAARLMGYVATGEAEVLDTMHDGNDFYGCAVGFSLLLGIHRWRVLFSERMPD